METKIITPATLRQIILLTLIACIAFCFQGCNGDEDKSGSAADTLSNIVQKGTIRIDTPKSMALFTISDSVGVTFSLPENYSPDSVVVSIGEKNSILLTGKSNSCSLSTKSCKTGSNLISAKAYKAGAIISGSVSVNLKSDIVPENFTYKIIKTYPHDANAYTQGLVYEKGFMFEGTGQYGESNLRKYKLETGELVQSYNLPDDVFGEGIVVYNNKIFQLTWQSHVAFEYEKESFRLVNKFAFNTEGWGITNLDDKLLMSDGTYTLYILDPQSFNELGRIEVFDNIGPVNQLNELENIDGLIYANVYQTDNIVIIDPKTGKVIGKINLTNLLDQTKVKSRIDVLNGIAWDADKRRLFVTGKWWPEIFEISLVKK